MFHARWRLAGYRLAATDEAWSAGEGQEVARPIAALLLLLTGRPAALDRMSGPGAAKLRDITADRRGRAPARRGPPSRS
jgi:hypothetical protein